MRILSVTLALLASTSAHAQTADQRVDQTFDSLPAVSDINSKLEVSGFFYEDADPLGAIAGAITFPLSHSFGLQIDAAGALNADSMIVGAGAHLFWRDPATGLIGLYGSVSHADFDAVSGTTFFVGNGGGGFTGTPLTGAALSDLTTARIAAEVEYYMDRWSFEGTGGVVLTDGGGTSIDGATFSASATLAYYVTDDLRADIGWEHGVGGHVGRFGVEWQTASTGSVGWAGFAQGSYAEGGVLSGQLGMRLYWGASRPLVERHRRDDPPIYLINEFGQVEIVAVEARQDGTVDEAAIVCPAGTLLRVDERTLLLRALAEAGARVGDYYCAVR